MSAWLGLPIMPDATFGNASASLYKFITPASIEEVRDYYMQTLPERGWKVEQSMPETPGKFIYLLANDKGGYNIYLGSPLNFIYIFTQNGSTRVEIVYTP